MFQKIIRIAKTFLPVYVRPPKLPFVIDEKDKNADNKFKEDLIDFLFFLAIFLAPFVAVALLILGLAICLSPMKHHKKSSPFSARPLPINNVNFSFISYILQSLIFCFFISVR